MYVSDLLSLIFKGIMALIAIANFIIKIKRKRRPRDKD